MKKRICAAAVTICMAIGLLCGTAAAMPFTDVTADAWYYYDVETAYWNQLINGKTASTFAPDDNLTYAEAVKLAACMNQRYVTGAVYLTNGDPWYQSYVDYAKEKGIITKNYAWGDPATRAGYMEIFANALPAEALAEKNTVVDNAIPDVPMTHDQAEEIYRLYRAGVLQGSDEAHNCKPDTNIKRSEVAAIMTRMMDANKRVSFELSELPLMAQLSDKELGVAEGQSVEITVTVTNGVGPYKYEWYQTGASGKYEKAAGADKTITLRPTEASQRVKCKVTDAEGRTAETEAMLITVTGGFRLTEEPKDQKAVYGSEVVLHVAASGGQGDYTYQWQARAAQGGTWGDLSGAVTDTLVLTARGDSAYRCIVTDASGVSITSSVIKLTVKR